MIISYIRNFMQSQEFISSLISVGVSIIIGVIVLVSSSKIIETRLDFYATDIKENVGSIRSLGIKVDRFEVTHNLEMASLRNDIISKLHKMEIDLTKIRIQLDSMQEKKGMVGALKSSNLLNDTPNI